MGPERAQALDTAEKRVSETALGPGRARVPRHHGQVCMLLVSSCSCLVRSGQGSGEADSQIQREATVPNTNACGGGTFDLLVNAVQIWLWHWRLK